MNNIRILELLDKKQTLLHELDNLLYGSVEIRTNDDKKYIYTHSKEDGIQKTKYIGDYNDQLYNLIIKNNLIAKQLKKEIKTIDKELKRLNYIDEELSKEVSINIDFARKHLIDTIYEQAVLEGVATTLSDTENIIEGGKVNNMSSEDIMKIINLKHAWDFVLNKNVILSPTNFSLLCTINKLLEEGFYYNAGALRTTPVKIGGTEWLPDIPIEVDIKEDINIIINSDLDDIDKAIELLLYTVRKQIFLDGNKRTSLIFANHYLISHGKGMIVIPADKADIYKLLLVNYYEIDNTDIIKLFLKQDCIIDLNNNNM